MLALQAHRIAASRDLMGVAAVALRRGPVKGHALAGSLLERLGEGGHGLLDEIREAAEAETAGG